MQISHITSKLMLRVFSGLHLGFSCAVFLSVLTVTDLILISFFPPH